MNKFQEFISGLENHVEIIRQSDPRGRKPAVIDFLKRLIPIKELLFPAIGKISERRELKVKQESLGIKYLVPHLKTAPLPEVERAMKEYWPGVLTLALLRYVAGQDDLQDITDELLDEFVDDQSGWMIVGGFLSEAKKEQQPENLANRLVNKIRNMDFPLVENPKEGLLATIGIVVPALGNDDSQLFDGGKKELAQKFGMSVSNFNRLIRKGVIRGIMKTTNSRWRVAKSTLEHWNVTL